MSHRKDIRITFISVFFFNTRTSFSSNENTYQSPYYTGRNTNTVLLVLSSTHNPSATKEEKKYPGALHICRTNVFLLANQSNSKTMTVRRNYVQNEMTMSHRVENSEHLNQCPLIYNETALYYQDR